MALGICTFSKYPRRFLLTFKLWNHWPKNFKAFLFLLLFCFQQKRGILATGSSGKVGVKGEGRGLLKEAGGRHSHGH